MVIVCPDCSTKFRVNPERIPAAGAKVRCARCKHIFLAQKPLPEAAPVAVSAEPDETPSAFVAAPIDDQEDFAAETPFADPTDADDGFSYDQFRDLDATDTEDEDFTFGSDQEPELATESTPTTPFDEEVFSDANEAEPFSFSDPEDKISAEETVDEDVEQIETVASASTKTAGNKDISVEEKIASIFADDEPVQAKDPELPPTAAAQPKSSLASTLFRILLLLILGLVIIGGALYFINGPEQIEQAIQQILGQQSSPAENGQIALNNLEGKFINNQESGELFVIRGEATNNFSEARAAIQVKGVIFDQNGKPLLQKTIFCGNPINDQELQTLPFSKLEEMMRNQFGKSLNNMKVNSKETIPFVIAFRDLPKNLTEFSVDVTSSEPAAK